jgi:PadR family transcriptional regulator, regulatory protein PadR
MEDLTGFQRDALYVITGLNDPHGLAIKDELEEYCAKEIHHCLEGPRASRTAGRTTTV